MLNFNYSMCILNYKTDKVYLNPENSINDQRKLDAWKFVIGHT